MYTHSRFTSLYNRNQHDIVKQLSSLKINLEKKKMNDSLTFPVTAMFLPLFPL